MNKIYFLNGTIYDKALRLTAKPEWHCRKSYLVFELPFHSCQLSWSFLQEEMPRITARAAIAAVAKIDFVIFIFTDFDFE
ncbi:MAG: hypothetical protein BGO32_01815 [Bacteroidetes bacterium 37-13]|nr:MAG: hypothetical protein BGO32_01815 [Bacteroidetes bacterium 37-13]